VRQQLYVFLILMPVVFGMTYLTLARALDNLSDMSPPAPVVQALIAMVCVPAIIALNLTRATRELYHLRQPTAFSEWLPVPKTTHLHFAMFLRLGRTAILALVLIVLAPLTGRNLIAGTAMLACLGIFIVLMTQAQVFAVLYWINWCHTKRRSVAAVALLVMLLTAMVGGILLLYFVNPTAVARLFTPAGSSNSGAAIVSISIYTIFGTASLLAGALYLIARLSHRRWRSSDIDYAQRIGSGTRKSVHLAGPWNRSLPKSVASMLARDLQLTFRIFSSSVYVVAGICIVLIMLLGVLLTTKVLPPGQGFGGGPASHDWLSATWLPSSLAIKLGCVLGVGTAAALLPVLLNYQLPHLWLERATGVIGGDLLKAKLWYTRLITFPVMVLMYATGVAASLIGAVDLPLFYLVPLLAECVWLWWVMSSFAGSLAFEIPDRPALSLVLILTIGIGSGGLTAFAWFFGLAAYGMGSAALKERGAARARHFLLSEVG
jgi:hypothetical protein